MHTGADCMQREAVTVRDNSYPALAILPGPGLDPSLTQFSCECV